MSGPVTVRELERWAGRLEDAVQAPQFNDVLESVASIAVELHERALDVLRDDVDREVQSRWREARHAG